MFQLGGNLFLDLEGTLIKDASDSSFLTEIIDSEWFSELVESAESISLFSWAITCQDDVNSHKWLIGAVEDRIGISFSRIILRDDFHSAFRRQFGAIDKIEFDELCRSLGKETVFQMFIRNIDPQSASISTLLDDMVDDTILCVGSKKIQTLSVNRIEAPKWQRTT